MDDTDPQFVDPGVTALTSVSELWAAFIGHVPYVLAAVAVFGLTWALARALDAFGQRLLRRVDRRESLKELIVRLLTLSVWMLGLLLTAIVLFPGLTPARALGGLGLVSIAVGLAFKDIFENFFAGILILWRFPLERGDYIECESLVGQVERVLVRMSYIRKTTGELVVVPNSFLFKNPVTVLTSLPHRRITLMTGIAYDEDVASSVEVIEAAVHACDTVLHDQPVQVFADGFGASSIDIAVTWWSAARPVDVRRSRAEVVTAIKRALDEAGIEIPYPYRTLVFKRDGPETDTAAGLAASPREPDR